MTVHDHCGTHRVEFLHSQTTADSKRSGSNKGQLRRVGGKLSSLVPFVSSNAATAHFEKHDLALNAP